MTSTADSTVKSSVSTCLDNKGGVGFRFEWSIKEWSKRPEKNGEHLESPHFVTMNMNNSAGEWSVWVYPRGRNDNDHLSLYMTLHKSGGRDLQAEFGFWIVNDKGTHKPIGCNVESFEEGRDCWGFSRAIKLEDLFKKENGYLPGDTLTLLCTGTDYGTCTSEHTASVGIWTEDWTRWNVESLFGERSATDVILSVSGRDIHAHKHILCKTSPVFQGLLRNQSSSEDKIEIVNHDYDVILAMVKFMYTGESYKLYALPEKLLLAAIQYKVDALQQTCETALIRKLTIQNAIPTLTLADEHSLQSMRTQVTEFISQHCEQVMQSDSWKELFGSNPQLAFEINAVMIHKLSINK